MIHTCKSYNTFELSARGRIVYSTVNLQAHLYSKRNQEKKGDGKDRDERIEVVLTFAHTPCAGRDAMRAQQFSERVEKRQ